MTQNEVNFLQEALGLKCSQLLTEIVENNNIVAKIKQEQNEQATKKQTKKESK